MQALSRSPHTIRRWRRPDIQRDCPVLPLLTGLAERPTGGAAAVRGVRGARRPRDADLLPPGGAAAPPRPLPVRLLLRHLLEQAAQVRHVIS